MKKSISRTPAVPSTTATIRVLKIGKCTSNSGKSKLTYQIGSVNGTDIYVCVTGNTGTGFYSKEWLSLDDIESICVKGKPFTSYQLLPLLRCKSTNTPAFLLAALLNEGLMQKGTKKKRTYEATDAAPFKAEAKRLYVTSVNLPAGDTATKHSATTLDAAKTKAHASTPAATASTKPATTPKKTPASGPRKQNKK